MSKKASSQSTQERALMNAINEKKKTDPLVGIKIGSKEVVQRLMQGLKNEKGVHIESLLAILGSLAGYSCHMAFRDELVNSGKHQEKGVFTIVETRDGSKYYFGDLPNKPLVEGQFSVWGLVAGITQHLQKSKLPDINTIFSHVSGTVGDSQFGIPRIPEKHKPGDLPINYVASIWPTLLPVIDMFCDKPTERPILLGLAIQQVIEMGKDVIPPLMAAQLVMECAVPMSKIGPDRLDKHV
ncbi:MAG TPA: hypothetical protein EYH38_01080 [Leucothrix sp.]|nr:hypothetical protein [Leucothrix sp.]